MKKLKLGSYDFLHGGDHLFVTDSCQFFMTPLYVLNFRPPFAIMKNPAPIGNCKKIPAPFKELNQIFPLLNKAGTYKLGLQYNFYDHDIWISNISKHARGNQEKLWEIMQQYMVSPFFPTHVYQYCWFLKHMWISLPICHSFFPQISCLTLHPKCRQHSSLNASMKKQPASSCSYRRQPRFYESVCTRQGPITKYVLQQVEHV